MICGCDLKWPDMVCQPDLLKPALLQPALRNHDVNIKQLIARTPSIQPVILSEQSQSGHNDSVQAFRGSVEQPDIENILFRNREIECPESALVAGMINKPHAEVILFTKQLLLTYEPAVTDERWFAACPGFRTEDCVLRLLFARQLSHPRSPDHPPSDQRTGHSIPRQ